MPDVVASSADDCCLPPLCGHRDGHLGKHRAAPSYLGQIQTGYRASLSHRLSLVMSTSDSGNLLPDPDRLTSLGSFLCRSGMDELPAVLERAQGRDEPGRPVAQQISGKIHA